MSIILVERNGLRTTVKIEAVTDTPEGVFTTDVLALEQVLGPYERRVIRQFAVSHVPLSATRELRFSSSVSCDGQDEPVEQRLRFEDGTYRVVPAALDFESVPYVPRPDGGASHEASFLSMQIFNDSNGSARFSLSIPPSSGFSIAGDTELSFTVPARTPHSVSVRFMPTEVGAVYSSSLTVRGGANFEQVVSLYGKEGGPMLQVPALIDFEKVAYFPTANPPTQTSRRFIVENVGRAIAGTDAGGDVFVATLGDFELAQTQSSAHVRFYWLDGGSWDAGLLLRPGELASLKAVLQPESLGLFQEQPRLATSNTRAIPVRADVQLFPPCELSVSSPLEVPLDGGVFDGGIKNSDTSICLVDELFIDQPTPYFELLAPPEYGHHELAAGEVLPLVIRANQSAFPDAGATLRFQASSPSGDRGGPIVAVP